MDASTFDPIDHCLGPETNQICTLCQLRDRQLNNQISFAFNNGAMASMTAEMNEETLLNIWKQSLTEIKDIVTNFLILKSKRSIFLHSFFYVSLGCDFPIIEALSIPLPLDLPIPTLMDINIHLENHTTALLPHVYFIGMWTNLKRRQLAGLSN